MAELNPGELSTDSVFIRQLRADDLASIVRVDRHAMGRSRTEYYKAKLDRVLRDQKLQTSLAAEVDGSVVGFLLATVYYGEFGQAEPVAVIDSIGVDPAFRKQHIGEALMRQLTMNLKALHVERLETQVDWTQRDLLSFLANQGFAPAPRFCLQLDLAK